MTFQRGLGSAGSTNNNFSPQQGNPNQQSYTF